MDSGQSEGPTRVRALEATGPPGKTMFGAPGCPGTHGLPAGKRGEQPAGGRRTALPRCSSATAAGTSGQPST